MQGQTTSAGNNLTLLIKVDSLFKYYGVIFDSSYNLPFKIQNIIGRFTPNETDIVTAESIFQGQYNSTNQVTESTKGARFITDVKKHFRKFNRQYIGYIDKWGNRNLIIQCFDYSKKRVVKKYIGDSWRNNFVIMFADKPPFEIVTYRVNLTEGKLYANW